ncbi:MAG: glycosyltransferase family 39 protein [Chloroflexi bacterium]|nr:glycosyltransferase family 39 protein [Chloroflexota bacterium]
MRVHQPYDRRDWAALAGVLCAAALLRLYRLEAAPPGLIFDELANVIDAAAIAAGERPLFLSGNLGREPLFHYLVALSFSLFGISLASFRLVSALLGIATVASTYLLARELAGRRVAIFAAALLAGSFWHVSLSRLGFRAVAMPLFGSLAFWLLWSGWRTGHRWQLALGGAFLGAGLYTYIPARLYPALALLLGAGWLFIPGWRPPSGRPGGFALSETETEPRTWFATKTQRHQGRDYLRGGLLAGALVCALVAAPLGWHFARHPDDFLGRSQSIGLGADPDRPAAVRLAENALATAGLFVVAGDANPHHNLSGRPAFDPLTAPLFLVGLLAGLWRIRAPRRAFLIAWLALLLLPGALAREAPHYLRTAGTIPAAYTLAGLGAAALTRRLEMANLLAVGVLAISFALTAHDYFVRWAPSIEAYRASAGDAFDAARLLRDAPARVPPAEDRLLGIRTYRGRSGELMLLGAEGQTRAFDATRTLVMPESPGRPTWYAFPVNRPDVSPSEERLRLLLEVATPVASRVDPAGREAAWLLRVEPGALRTPRPERALPATIGEAVELVGYDLPRRARPGETVPLVVHWRVVGQLPAGRFWQFFAHVTRAGAAWASDYHEGFEPEQWRPGDRVASWFNLRLPESLPVDTYAIEFGLFDRTTGDRLPIVDGQRQSVGNVLLLGPLRIARADADGPTPSEGLGYTLGESIHLVGFDIRDRSVAPGGKLRLTLYWQATSAVPRDYTVFTHLVDAGGRLIAQQDSQPQRGSYPTTLWAPGETVRDEYELTLPADAPSGSATILVGMYLLESGERLPVQDEAGRPSGDAAPLARVEVVGGPPRAVREEQPGLTVLH